MSFFKRLRDRTARDPDSSAERALARKLDAEFARDFGAPGFWERVRRAFAPGEFLRYAPVAALGVAVVFFAGKIEHPASIGKSGAPVVAGEADGFEEDLAFYEELDDWMLAAIAEE